MGHSVRYEITQIEHKETYDVLLLMLKDEGFSEMDDFYWHDSEDNLISFTGYHSYSFSIEKLINEKGYVGFSIGVWYLEKEADETYDF